MPGNFVFILRLLIRYGKKGIRRNYGRNKKDRKFRRIPHSAKRLSFFLFIYSALPIMLTIKLTIIGIAMVGFGDILA